MGVARAILHDDHLTAATYLRHALAAMMLVNFGIAQDAAAVTIVDFGVAAWQAAFPQPIAINNQGDVAGVLSTAAGPEPFVWLNGVMTPLPTLQVQPKSALQASTTQVRSSVIQTPLML